MWGDAEAVTHLRAEARQFAGHARGVAVHAVRHGAAGDADDGAVSEVRV